MDWPAVGNGCLRAPAYRLAGAATARRGKHEPFGRAVRSRAPPRDIHRRDADIGQDGAERRRELAGTVEHNDETKAVSRSRIDRLCRRRDVPLREKTLWRMLYETTARAAEVLSLNIDEDLDVANRQAPSDLPLSPEV